MSISLHFKQKNSEIVVSLSVYQEIEKDGNNQRHFTKKQTTLLVLNRNLSLLCEKWNSPTTIENVLLKCCVVCSQLYTNQKKKMKNNIFDENCFFTSSLLVELLLNTSFLQQNIMLCVLLTNINTMKKQE